MTTPPFFRKVNPGDFPVLFISLISPTLPLSTVNEYGETLLAQQISQLSGRRPGAGLRRAEIRRARAGRSGGGGGAQHLARRHPHRRCQGQFQHPGRHADRARPATSRCTASGAMRHADDYRNVVVGLAQRRAGQARRNRQRHRQRRERQDRELVQRRPRRSCSRSSGSPTPTRSRWSTLVSDQLPQFRAQVPAVDPHGDAASTARSRSARRSSTCRRRC